MKNLHYQHQVGLALYQQIQASPAARDTQLLPQALNAAALNNISNTARNDIIPGLLDSAFKAYPIRFISTHKT
ncbi:MAG: hypothetical protein H0W44_09300 [Gammaproteobacteria bacterium]|nr:hypothetical protein [Gammaproteobacteria bacterium]